MPIKFENVSFTYGLKTPYEHDALFNVNLEIKDGSFTCIVGHTGSGKSTLIQLMNGLLKPTNGQIYVNDFVISSDKKKSIKKFHDLRKEVGIVFQFPEYQLFDETIEDDVAFGPCNFGVDKKKAIEIAHGSLKKVGIDETFYKKSPFELSGGEKRRTAIAGILAIQPKILVLDEPTAGLDPLGMREIMDLVKSLNKNGTTIVVVTHDMNIVLKYATDVIVMNEGRIVKESKPYELFLENVDKYSLEDPLLSKFIKQLWNNGFKLDISKVTDLESLCEQIVERRQK